MARETVQLGDRFGLRVVQGRKAHKSPCDHPCLENPGVSDPDLCYRI